MARCSSLEFLAPEGDNSVRMGLMSSAEVASHLPAAGCVLHLLLLLVSPSEIKAYVNPLVCICFAAVLPIWVVITKKNEATREVLYSGWHPVVMAMGISR